MTVKEWITRLEELEPERQLYLTIEDDSYAYSSSRVPHIYNHNNEQYYMLVKVSLHSKIRIF